MTREEFIEHILPLKGKLYRFAYSFLGREADAKDIVQEVMLSAWEKIKDPTKINSLEAWCMSLTRNKSLNLIKRKGRNYIELGFTNGILSSDISPHQQMAEKDSFDRIRDIIDQLPELQKQVIILRDIDGFSYKEITEILQLEMNHVKVLLFRARKKIKEQLIRENNYGISEA